MPRSLQRRLSARPFDKGREKAVDAVVRFGRCPTRPKPSEKAIFAPNANWHAGGTGVLPGKYRGVQAIFEFLPSSLNRPHPRSASSLARGTQVGSILKSARQPSSAIAFSVDTSSPGSAMLNMPASPCSIASIAA